MRAKPLARGNHRRVCAGAAASSASGRRAAYATAAQLGLFVLTPILLTAFALVVLGIQGGATAYDFRFAYWPAGDHVLHGQELYSPSARDLQRHVAFVYPAAAALLFAPFALIPLAGANVLITVLTLSAPLLTLRLLAVRDWRLYGLVLLWPPVFYAWVTGNLTMPLLLGLAGLWRLRERSWAAGLLLALMISVKPLVWPLALWFLATRRYATLGACAAGGVLINVVAWSIVGFHEIARFSGVLRDVTAIEQHRGYSLAVLASDLGLSESIGFVATALVAAVLGAACLWAGRRGEETVALAFAVGTMLLASPIFWIHYVAFLIVPLAITRPRLDAVWLLPLLTVVCPITPPSTWQHLLLLVVVGVVLAGAAGALPSSWNTARRSPRPGGRRWSLDGRT